MDRLWLDAPALAIKVWRDGGDVAWRANRALLDWALRRGVGATQWRAFALDLLDRCGKASFDPIDFGDARLHVTAVWMDGAWLLWLQPVASEGEDQRAARWLSGVLGVVEEFGRLAVFERNTRTGVGRWSPHMFDLLGFEHAASPPSLEDAFGRIHPADRERVLAEWARLSQVAGGHESRFRLMHPNGDVRHVHALYEVGLDSEGSLELLVGVLVDDTDVIERMERQEQLNTRLTQGVNLASVSTWRIDAATQRIEFNDYGYRLTGLAAQPGGVPVEAVRATIHPDDVDAVIRAANDALAGHGVIDVEARYRHPDGNYHHMLTRRVAERDESGRAVALMGVSIDQTQQVVERERARTLAHRIDIITQAAGVGVWSVDLSTDESEWNDQMFHIYGLPVSPQPPTLHDVLERRIHRDDRAFVEQQRTRLASAGRKGAQYEYRIVRPDGSVRWVSTWSRRETTLDGRLMAYGVTTDITERHDAQTRLRDMDVRALLAAESAGIGTWERDFSTSTTLWNAQMYRLRGMSPDCGMSPEQVRRATHHPEDGPPLESKFVRAATHGDDYEHEFRVIWPDGSMHWLATRGIVRRDASGRVDRITGVNWDITERKRAEQALRDKASAEQASRAKSEFLSRMSHELRTPLNAVLGFAQLLLYDSEALAGRQGEWVRNIHSAGLHLMALIDDVLDLASIESNTLKLEIEAVSLHSAIDEVLQWIRPQAERTGITLHVTPVPGWVRADGRRLRQILVNLLSNAIKYNRRDGEVWLDAQPMQLREAEGWQLRVRDGGRGMSAEQRSHLFEPFNRLGVDREAIEGTGIGLTIVHHLVGLMDGIIEVDSEPGRGSEFRVALPAASPADSIASEQQHDDVPLPPGQSDRPLSILYVEDNEVNVMLVQHALTSRPHMRLLTARDGTSGVAMARADQPDVLLVDMQLPDFDGFEVLRRLKAEPTLADRPVIALSASAMPEDVRRAMAAGFDDYWTKPIDFAAFLADLDALAVSRR